LKNAKNDLIEAKIDKLTESVIPHQTLFQHQHLATCNLPSNMKSSSHKTWQTSLIFLKPLQIQNLIRKKCGGHGILYPLTWKSGGHVPRVPHQIAPMSALERICLGCSSLSMASCQDQQSMPSRPYFIKLTAQF